MRHWRKRGLFATLLLPIGLFFFLVAALRRFAYRHGWRRSERLPVPVVVVGNLVAGGAGKTPLVIWLAQRLCALGRRPGIVSRGHGRLTRGVLAVDAGKTAEEVGEEPLLIYRRSGRPVVVGANRVAAARTLLAMHPECDLILCDDGLQHYRLARDVEIVVVDRRGFMNAWPLPAGPLREPARRLAEADAWVCHDCPDRSLAATPRFAMRLRGNLFYRLDDPHCKARATDLAGLRLAAIAGIGEPERFFDHLRALGVEFSAHPFPDHHCYRSDDLRLPADALIMTEKDALKCHGLSPLPIWVLPVEAELEPDLARFVVEKIDGLSPSRNPRLSGM